MSQLLTHPLDSVKYSYNTTTSDSTPKYNCLFFLPQQLQLNSSNIAYDCAEIRNTWQSFSLVKLTSRILFSVKDESSVSFAVSLKHLRHKSKFINS